jgi:hypothetical protein
MEGVLSVQLITYGMVSRLQYVENVLAKEHRQRLFLPMPNISIASQRDARRQGFLAEVLMIKRNAGRRSCPWHHNRQVKVSLPLSSQALLRRFSNPCSISPYSTLRKP